MGYSIAFLSQYLICFYVCYAAVIGISFGIGSYWFFFMLTKDIANNFIELKRIEEIRRAFFSEFCKLIQQHSDAKQFSK